MKKSNVGKLALAGVLAAVTFLLGLTPIGIIPIPPANVTLMCLPVIIGTLTTSLGLGMVLGLVFGITSVIRAFTAPSVLVVPLLGASPALVVVMSVSRADPGPRPEGYWVVRPDLNERIAGALRCHASQVTVRGDRIQHVGGQTEPVPIAVGLRRG